MRIVVIFVAINFAFISQVAADESNAGKTFENAEYLCKVMDNTHLTSDQCDVSGWHQSVTVTVDMTPDAARQVCDFVARDLAQRNRRFSPGWTLKIKSPYSGDNAIAYCDLPALVAQSDTVNDAQAPSAHHVCTVDTLQYCDIPKH